MQPVRRPDGDGNGHGADPGFDGRFHGRMRRRVASADVQADGHVLFRHGLEQGFPVWVVDARQALDRRVLVDRDRRAALAGNALQFLRHQFRVPARQNRTGNEPSRIRPAPLVDVPVVVGAQVRDRLGLVRRLDENAAVKSRPAAEVERRRNAIDVHVVDASVWLVDALAQLGKGRRLDAVFLRHAPDHGVETHGR